MFLFFLISFKNTLRVDEKLKLLELNFKKTSEGCKVVIDDLNGSFFALFSLEAIRFLRGVMVTGNLTL